jgi:hypothetical protein
VLAPYVATIPRPPPAHPPGVYEGSRGGLEVWQAVVQVKERRDGGGLEYVPVSVKKKADIHSTLTLSPSGLAEALGRGNGTEMYSVGVLGAGGSGGVGGWAGGWGMEGDAGGMIGLSPGVALCGAVRGFMGGQWGQSRGCTACAGAVGWMHGRALS